MALISCPTTLRYVPGTLWKEWSPGGAASGQRLPEATGAGKGRGARFDTFLYFSAKTWQHTSRAPAELGFLSVSKEEFQPLVTWQEKGIKRGWRIPELPTTETQEELEAGTSISKTVVELTRFDALNTGFGNFPYSDQHFPTLFQCPVPPAVSHQAPKYLDINKVDAASKHPRGHCLWGVGLAQSSVRGAMTPQESLHLTRVRQSSASTSLHQTSRFIGSQDLSPTAGMPDTSEGQPQTSQDIPPCSPQNAAWLHRDRSTVF